MEFKQIQKLLLKHIEVLNEEKMVTGIPTIKITEIAKELKQAFSLHNVVQAKPEKFCKGSMQLGTGCGKCSRCLDYLKTIRKL